jgi:hypothetical protein
MNFLRHYLCPLVGGVLTGTAAIVAGLLMLLPILCATPAYTLLGFVAGTSLLALMAIVEHCRKHTGIRPPHVAGTISVIVIVTYLFVQLLL